MQNSSPITKALRRWEDEVDYIPDERERRFKKILAKTACGIITAVQMAVHLPLLALEKISHLLKSAKIILGRWIHKLTSIPTYAKKIFFPSKDQILEKRVEDLNHYLTHKTGRNALFRARGREISHEEKMEMMNEWLSQQMFELPSDGDRFRELMNEIADGDLSGDVLQECRHEAIAIADRQQSNKRILSFLRTFVGIFQEERKKVFSEKNDPRGFLEFPHLLKDERAEAYIKSLKPSSLKVQLEKKRQEVNLRTLQKMHQRENECLGKVRHHLRLLDFEKIKEKYLSEGEGKYLEARISEAGQNINKLVHEEGKDHKSFEHYMLEIEVRLLNEQKSSWNVAKKTIEETSFREAVDQGNSIVKEEIHKFSEFLTKQTKTRIGVLPKSPEREKIEKAFAELKYPVKNEEIEPFLSQVESLYRELHSLEQGTFEKLDSQSTALHIHRTSQVDFNKYISNVEQTQNGAAPWKDLQEMKTCEERKRIRQEALADEVICLCLEQRESGDCLLALDLAGKSLRSEKCQETPCAKNSALSRIRKYSTSFVASLIEKHRNDFMIKLRSREEFIMEVQRDQSLQILDETLACARTELRFDIKKMSLSINPQTELLKWGCGLQKIWQECLSYEDRESILNVSKAKRKGEMKRSFDRWLLQLTGSTIPFSLSFEGIEIQDLSDERQEAVESLAAKMAAYEKRKEKGWKHWVEELRSADPEEITSHPQTFEGFQTQLIKEVAHLKKVTLPRIPSSSDYIVSRGELQLTGYNVIEVLGDTIERIQCENSEDDYKHIEAYIHALTGIEFQGLQDRHLMIRNLCMMLASEKQAISEEIIKIFVESYRDDDFQLQFNHIENSARSMFLSAYLTMIFADGDYRIKDETERRYCVQICELSDLSIEEKQEILSKLTIETGSSSRPCLLEIGQRLQMSPVLLEGLEESVIQRSFQECGKDSLEQRKLLDRMRYRSGNETGLLEFLFEDMEMNGKIHPQERETFLRAFHHAFKSNSQKAIDFIKEKISKLSPGSKSEVNDDTMAPNKVLILHDVLSEYLPLDEDLNGHVKQFNEEMIASNDAHKMLYGCSREIVRITRQWTHSKTISPEDFARLLKCKMEYQKLKKEHFGEKRKLGDEVELAVMSAETAIIASYSLYESNTINLGEILPHFLKSFLSSGRPCDVDHNWVFSLKKVQPSDLFKEHEKIPGMISYGTRLQIDAILGTCYLNGNQQVQLSPHSLQNDPTLRSLGLNSLPYMKDSEGAFCYVADENGQKVAQVKVFYNEEYQEVTIQKRLPVSFTDRTPKLLQFVPREKITLPSVVEHRLNVKQFWKSQEGDLYGFDEDGELVAIIQKDWNTTRIFTRKQKDPFDFLSDNDVGRARIPLNYLLSCFSPDDILYDPKNESYWIPGADLQLTKDANNTWGCEGRGLSGLVLDTEVPPCAYIPLRQEGYQSKIEDTKNKLRVAKERLEEARKKYPHPSHLHRDNIERLKQGVDSLENKLSELKGRVCFTTLSEIAFDSEETENVFDAIQELFESQDAFQSHDLYEDIPDVKALSDKFQEDKNSVVPYEVYTTALNAVKDRLIDLRRQMEGNDSDNLRSDYLAFETFYHEIFKLYEKDCVKMMERALFRMSENETLSSNNLSAALILCTSALRSGQLTELSSFAHGMIQELAKYPLLSPLSEGDYKILDTVSDLLQNEENRSEKTLDQLRLYLSFMKYQHITYKIEELSHSPLNNQQEYVTDILEEMDQCRSGCEQFCSDLQEDIRLNRELVSLWRHLAIDPDTLNKYVAPVKIEKSESQEALTHLRRELEILSGQTLLERLYATSTIKAEPKNMMKELSPEQRVLIRNFRLHSPEEVAGFYLEEMGRFNEGTLFTEFGVEHHDEKGLFGITQEDVKSIFARMCDEGWITREPAEGYYSLKDPAYALDKFNRNIIKSHLIDKAYSEKNIDKILNRLQAFLFRAMQSGYKFSSQSESTADALIEQLQEKKEAYRQKYLEAEYFFMKTLTPYGLQVADIKYAFLTGDVSRLPKNLQTQFDSIRNALVRYLVYKTEVQHIENIERAPLVGERNKIELLQTRRNYSIDLLLRGEVSEEEREEQIMQRAFLVFEEDYGYRCNAMQIRMFGSLLRTPGHNESIDAAQARMGFGKTALLPLMAIVRVALERTQPDEKKHLVRYVVPRAVIEDNRSSFNEKLSKILGRNVTKDREFSRYQIDKEAKKQSLRLIKDDLNNRLTRVQQAFENGDVLIQWPEIRESMEAQELDFAQLIIEGQLNDDEMALLLECKQILAKIRSLPTYTVFDELDDTQDIKSREVNYTRGDKKLISKVSIRPLEKIVFCIEKASHDFSDLRRGAQELLTAVGLGQYRYNDMLIKYLTDRSQLLDEELCSSLDDLGQGLKNSSKEITSEEVSAVFLIRAILLDSNMLALAKSKQPNTHFGARFVEKGGKRIYFKDPDSKSVLLIAVPYEGTNTPKGMSIFDNTEVAAVTTMRYYLSSETNLDRNPHLDFLLTQMRESTIDEELSKHYLEDLVNRQGKSPLIKLKEMTELLDAEELKKAKEDFYHDFMENPDPRFRKFFAIAVVTTQIRSDAACTKSDRYEKGSQNCMEKGCSGTVGGTSSYFKTQSTDPAADGKLSIEIMGRTENQAVKVLTPPDSNKDYLKEILTTLIKSAEISTRAIVDAAGMCKSRDGTPETIVKELWKILNNDSRFTGVFKGIIYYGKDGVKRLYLGDRSIPCNTAVELDALRRGEKYFSFYGQKNTRGSDIKQADGAHALVTLDENVSNSDAKQAVLRFRNLVNRDSKQTFSFAFMPSFEGIVQKRLANEIQVRKQSAEKIVLDAEQKIKEANEKIKGARAIVKRGDKEAQAKAAQEIDAATKVIQEAEGERAASLALISTLEKKCESSIRIQTKELSQYLRLGERDLSEKASLMIFRKEMAAHVKQAASHLDHYILSKLDLEDNEARKSYIEYLKARDQIVKFSTPSISSLYAKYGKSTKEITRDEHIDEEKAKAEQALCALFNAANICLSSDIDLDKTFYEEHIERSVSFFKNRFGEHTPVRKSEVDSEAMAIVEALAEAEDLSEALAEVLAEKIVDREIEISPPLPLPRLRMSENPERFMLNLDFLDVNKCTKIEAYEPLKDMVLKTERGRFFVSPHLVFAHAQRVPLAPHFFIKRGDHMTFISHEEADLLKREEKTQGKQQDTLLFDAHSCKCLTDDTYIIEPKDRVQIQCVVLGDNGASRVKSEGLTTQALRKLTLHNVVEDQFLPHLEVKKSANAEDYFSLTRFGLKSYPTVSIESKIDSHGMDICVGVKGKEDMSLTSMEVAFHKNNPYLTEVMTTAFSSSIKRSKRLDYALELIMQKENDYRAQRKKLDAKMAELDVKKREITRLVSGVKQFQATPSMVDGLTSRDDEWSDRHNKESKEYGKKFIEKLNEIENYRLAFLYFLTGNKVGVRDSTKTRSLDQVIEQIQQEGRSQSQDPVMITTNYIRRCFGEFISDDLLTKAVDLVTHRQYTTNPIITKEEWGNSSYYYPTNKGREWKPFDLVYGRILHGAHGSNVGNAFECTRHDCEEMFAHTLPDLVQAVKNLSVDNLKQVVTNMEPLREAQKKIEDEIAALEAEIKMLPEAKKTVETFVKTQREIETRLSQKGMRLSEEGEFFDQFALHRFYGTSPDWKEFDIQLTGYSPEYDAVFTEMGVSKSTLSALNATEAQVYLANRILRNKVMDLAWMLEERPQEMRIEAVS